ncbi:hypothetical protein HPP92_028142, partial [Vanilla planifolia]
METLPTAVEKQSLVSRFLEIAVGQTVETATQFLQATSWKLEDAIELFCIGNDGVGGGSASASASIPVEQNLRGDGNIVSGYGGGKESAIDEVRAPLPAKKDTLYGDASFVRMLPNTIVAFRDFNQESRRPEVWESDQSAPSTTDGTRDNLASLYRPPFSLMYNGPFDK